MNIPTANIVVAFDKKVMERLFSAGATYTSLVSKLSEGIDDALLFNNSGNSNFISLEHTQNLGSGFKIKLSFIDPKNEFERRFFTDNAAEIIERYSSPTSEKTKGFVTDNKNDMKQSQRAYENKFISQFKQELQLAVGDREIYVAYGTGNNLDLWSGPHRTVLTAADISVDGSRKITLTLTPTPNALKMNQRRGAYNERVNLNLVGLQMRYAGGSQEIDFLSDKAYDPVKYLIDAGVSPQSGALSDGKGLASEDRGVLAEIGLEQAADKIEKFDFHCIVVDAIRSYVQKATSNKNVIVLLPNLNVTCAKAINETAKTYKVVKPASQALGNIPVATGVSKGYKLSVVTDLFDKTGTDRGNEEMFVRSTLQSFGLRLHSGNKEDAQKSDKDALTAGLIPHAASERFPTAKDAIDDYYEKRFFTAVIDKSDREIPDHMRVLEVIFDRIKERSHEAYKMSSLAVIEETDIKVLEEWGVTSFILDSYTFGGYDKFEGDSAIIVGDLALIQDYLYAGIDLEKKEKDIASLKRSANYASIRSKVADIAEEVLKPSIVESIEKGYEEQGKEFVSSEAYTAAAAVQIPLHPLDKVTLTNKTYNKRMKKLLNPVLKGSGSFGDISYFPDDFAYKDSEFSDVEKKYIEENGIPIFRYNTQNPNTLSLNFKFAPIYFAQLKAGFQKEIQRLASAVGEGILPTGIGSFPIRDRGAAIAYARMKDRSQGIGDKDKQKIIDELALSISPELAASLKLNSSEAAADFVASYVEKLTEDDLHGIVKIDQELPGSPQTILADFAEDMYRKAFQMNITTLPTFHISKSASLGSPCMFFGQDQPITQSVRPNSQALNKFFSGLYKILGYRHTITTGEALSEFKLVKNSPKFEVEKK